MSKNKLIIISNDALVYEDMKYLASKPAIRELFDKGSIVKSLKTVYPSITYACHASMITGCYPDRTGVYNNEVDEFGKTEWNWERNRIKVKTLLDCAKENGLTTANVFWPVLGKDDNIDYNIPEYWSQTPDESLVDALKSMGTSDQVIEDIVKPNLYYIEGHQRQHPYCDEFIFSCARDMIKKYQPDVLVLHPAGIDGMRHGHGIFNDYVTEQLDYTYYWIEKIVRALKEEGLFENTNIILTSDHGQMDMKRVAHPNFLLEEFGFLTRNDKGEYENVMAYAKPVGGSCQIFMKDKSKIYLDAMHSFLTTIVKNGLHGIEKFYTKEQAKNEERLAGDFDFVLETDGYTAFTSKMSDTYFTEYDTSDYRSGKGTHGYHPDKGPQPCMLVVGPDFKTGIEIERRDTVDMAKTVASIYNWELDCDGKVIKEIIKTE